MRYYTFSTHQSQKNGDRWETREMEIVVQAWKIKEAYTSWNKIVDKHQEEEGWFVTGNYLHSITY